MRTLRRPSAGSLDGLVLTALVGPAAHGYRITSRLRDAAGLGGDAPGDLPEGTVYAVLHRLERDGLVRSAWADVDSRRRRVYELTGAGAAAVEVIPGTAPAWRVRPARFRHL